jgi:hypothetical protein
MDQQRDKAKKLVTTAIPVEPLIVETTYPSPEHGTSQIIALNSNLCFFSFLILDLKIGGSNFEPS